MSENLVEEWIAHQSASQDSEEAELHWTDEYLIDLALSGGFEELWEFVLATYPCDLPDQVLAVLAAGPMEDLLVARGEEYIERVEALAIADEKFKSLLGGVWRNAMSDQVWERLCAVRGEPW